MTESLTDDVQGGFRRGGRGSRDQFFTLKQMCEKDREKKCRLYVGFMELEKAYDRVNRASNENV